MSAHAGIRRTGTFMRGNANAGLAIMPRTLIHSSHSASVLPASSLSSSDTTSTGRVFRFCCTRTRQLKWLSVCLPCQISPCHVGQDADGLSNSADLVLAWRQGSHTDACVLWCTTEHLPRWPSCAAWCRAGARSPSCCTPTATSGGPPTCGLTPPSRRACTVAQQSPQSHSAAAHTAPLPHIKPCHHTICPAHEITVHNAIKALC